MSSHMPGFEAQEITANGVSLHVEVGGKGAPLVLLHGFPETHMAWRLVAPELAKNYTVICPDLRGYGESDKPLGDETHEQYTKRTMANDILELMRGLGHDRFAVMGHDRGGLVGFRLALDHPEAVSHLVILDVIPTVDLWESLQGIFGVFGYHQFLLAQPPDFPEKLIGAAPELFIGHTLDTWTKDQAALPPKVRSAYIEALSTPESIHAFCEDYRASAFVDREHDVADKKAGKQIAAPVFVLWQDPGEMKLPFEPLEIWRGWAKKVQGHSLPCGHFVAEEKPAEVIAAVRAFVGEGTTT